MKILWRGVKSFILLNKYKLRKVFSLRIKTALESGTQLQLALFALFLSSLCTRLLDARVHGECTESARRALCNRIVGTALRGALTTSKRKTRMPERSKTPALASQLSIKARLFQQIGGNKAQREQKEAGSYLVLQILARIT